MNKLDQYFAISQRGSKLSTEILAGVSTFLALSYIFVVNPAILENAGMDKSFVLFATIVVSALATIIMGFWARLPFVLAPGMEMNAYVAFFVVGTLGFTWQQALGAVFWSGIIFMILTLLRVRENIISAIPQRMKSALSLSVGVFLILVALSVVGVLEYSGVTLTGVGAIFSKEALILVFGLVVILILDRLKVTGSVLISIILATFLAHGIGISTDGETPFSGSRMLDGVGKLDIGVIFDPRILSAILVLFLVDFYGSVAKFIGLTENTNLPSKGRLPRMRQALSIDGIATLLGSGLGTTSVTTYVESGVGIGVGGRTGLSAVVCGLLMLTTFFALPLLRYIPVIATTGALVYVGLKLAPTWTELSAYTRTDLIAGIVMQITVIATFAIDKAMLLGFMIYIGVDSFEAGKKPNPFLIGSTILLIVGTIFQFS